jgi:hypothetical protein
MYVCSATVCIRRIYPVFFSLAVFVWSVSCEAEMVLLLHGAATLT